MAEDSANLGNPLEDEENKLDGIKVNALEDSQNTEKEDGAGKVNMERKLLDKFLRILPSELYNNSCYCIKVYLVVALFDIDMDV